MSLIPKTVPTGAIRYNTDSNKMECFNGTKWMQIAVSSPDLDGGARGLIGGGYGGGSSPYHLNNIQYITITTAGNSIDFGDRTIVGNGGSFSSATRGVMGGALAPVYVLSLIHI